jgi:hypothetical protein
MQLVRRRYETAQLVQIHRRSLLVMPGLVPGIHVLATPKQGVDGRDRPGHDE